METRSLGRDGLTAGGVDLGCEGRLPMGRAYYDEALSPEVRIRGQMALAKEVFA